MKALTSHLLRDHVLIGAVAAALLVPVFGIWGSLIFWLATILIDLDHYLNFVVRCGFKHFSLPLMFRFHHALFQRKDRRDYLDIEIFHTAEFFALFAVLAFGFFPPLVPAFWGLAFHIAVDLVHLACHRILARRAHTFIEYFLRVKYMRSKGMDPDIVFLEALCEVDLPGKQA